MLMPLTRRSFLSASASLTLACAAPPPAPAPSPSPAARLAVVRDGDHASALDRALALAGADLRGETVLVKVNTNSGDPYPYSSSPTAVGHLCARLAAEGARVVVGDRSFWGDPDTAGNLERNGIAPAARAAGARVVVFDDDVAWVEVPPELVPSWRPPVRVPRLAVEARVVNLACLKTHFISGSTLALKNFLGLVHADDRARPGNLRSHDRRLVHRQIAELHRFVRAAVHVIDAHRALCAGGPTPTSGADPVIRELGVVVASTDPAAADAAGVALLRRHAVSGEAVHDALPWQSPTVAAALALGVGARTTASYHGVEPLGELG